MRKYKILLDITNIYENIINFRHTTFKMSFPKIGQTFCTLRNNQFQENGEEWKLVRCYVYLHNEILAYPTEFSLNPTNEDMKQLASEKQQNWLELKSNFII